MQRICRSLALAGYSVVLVGRQTNPAQQPSPQPFEQVLLPCPFASGKWMYAAFNWQLYRYLSRQLKQLAKTGAASAICAIDLDTILPCLLVSKRFNVPRVYDAHELFTELTEVKSRPLIHALWTRLERHAVPQFKQGYTVNAFIAQEFTRRYAVQYAVVRNLPLRSKAQAPMPEETLPPLPPGRFLLYQGAVNEGRSFETLVPAMLAIDMPLVIAGDGNYMPQLKKLIAQNNLQHKIWLLGLLPPGVLKQLTPLAYVGLTLFDDTGLNQYYSLANRFFDYIQAGIPQICINYPEYAAICDPESPALLISDTKSSTIALAVNKLTANHVLYQQLTLHAQNAAARLCWEKEEQILIDFWNSVINP
ncbi:MAG: group 1 glycosyl transferase [Bacteroidetes bacterium]|nr:MAG: group 1 glycosyl transferase [Bacteroidota bacterium]